MTTESQELKLSKLAKTGFYKYIAHLLAFAIDHAYRFILLCFFLALFSDNRRQLFFRLDARFVVCLVLIFNNTNICFKSGMGLISF